VTRGAVKRSFNTHGATPRSIVVPFGQDASTTVYAVRRCPSARPHRCAWVGSKAASRARATLAVDERDLGCGDHPPGCGRGPCPTRAACRAQWPVIDAASIGPHLHARTSRSSSGPMPRPGRGVELRGLYREQDLLHKRSGKSIRRRKMRSISVPPPGLDCRSEG